MSQSRARQYADIVRAMNNENNDNIVAITEVKRKRESRFEILSRLLFLKSADGIESALSLAIENLVNTFGEDTVRKSIIENLGEYNGEN